MEKELTESQKQTAQSCFNMFERWKTKTEKKGKTPAHYIQACIEGYPNGTKIKPALLKTRLRGIVRFAPMAEVPSSVDEKIINKANELISNYKEKYKEMVSDKN